MQAPDRRGYLMQQLALAGWTSLPWLWRLRQPTLILAGTRDPLIHVANAKLMHRLIPNSRLQLVDDGHLFLLTSREVVADIIVAISCALTVRSIIAQAQHLPTTSTCVT